MFTEAKDDGIGCSYKSCKAPVKSSPPTNQHPVFLQAGCPSCHTVTRPTMSKHWRENITHGLAYPKLTWGSSNFVSDHFDLLVFYFQLQKVVGKSRFPSVNYCIEMWVYTSNPGVLYGSFSNLTGFESMSHQICCFCQIGLNVINSQHYSLQYIVHDILSLSCSRMHYDDKQQPAHLMALNWG